MITELKPNEVFVFGSNLAGHHGAGAAKQAHEKFGAVWGIGEGLTGQCYAFPSLGRNIEKRGRQSLEVSRRKFFSVARKHPDKLFLMTKVGCGLAGYPESAMKSLFTQRTPANVVLPSDWK